MQSKKGREGGKVGGCAVLDMGAQLVFVSAKCAYLYMRKRHAHHIGDIKAIGARALPHFGPPDGLLAANLL